MSRTLQDDDDDGGDKRKRNEKEKMGALGMLSSIGGHMVGVLNLCQGFRRYGMRGLAWRTVMASCKINIW